jgi:prolyl oligopeptidase
MRRFAALLGLIGLTSALTTAAESPDSYRWMEGPHNAKFADWLRTQGKEGQQHLDASPARAKWRTRLTEVSAATTLNRDQHRVGDRVFFLHLESGKQGVLKVRVGGGAEKVLFDPNTLPGQAHASITRYTVSPDGKKVALNIDRGGNEITQIEFLDVDSGRKLPDVIDHVWGEFSAIWNGNDAVFYTQMSVAPGQTDQMLGMRARYHKLGSATSTDLTVAAAGANPTFRLAPQEFPSIVTDPSSDWTLVVVSGARAEGRLCVLKTAELIAPNPRYRCIVDYEDSVQGVGLHGSVVYLQSVKNAPNGKVLALDVGNPKAVIADAKVMVPEDKEAVLTGMAPARDGVYIRRMRVGIDSISRLSYDGKSTDAIKLPYDGQAALLDTNGDQDGLVLTLQGWTQPRTLYSYDPKSKSLTDLRIGANSPKDYPQLVAAINTEARSLDGTSIPVTILKPKGVEVGPDTLAIVMAYGAYGLVVTQPAFNPMRLEWVTAGNLFVYAGIRGGGEKGDAWRLAGKGENKHHGIEDVVAAADMLVAQHYVTRDHVALYSASAGGIIVGGAVDRFPDHFGAAIIHAGMLNPTRLAFDTNGANQYAEFGDPTTEAGLKQLHAMDAYLNIRDRVAYPAVLLDVGLNDNRVAPWNSGKYGARLQAANTSSRLIIFRTDADSGHFGTSLSQEAAERADDYTFVEMTLNSKSAPANAK